MVADFKMNQEKLKQLQAQVRIGGKGTARRKKKVVHRTATTDDKKLQSSLKKLSGDEILSYPPKLCYFVQTIVKTVEMMVQRVDFEQNLKNISPVRVFISSKSLLFLE